MNWMVSGAVPEVGVSVKAATGTVDTPYVYWSADEVVDVPIDVVTVTSTTAPAVELAGEVAVIWVSLFTVYEVAAVLPKLTAVTAPAEPPA